MENARADLHRQTAGGHSRLSPIVDTGYYICACLKCTLLQHAGFVNETQQPGGTVPL